MHTATARLRLRRTGELGHLPACLYDKPADEILGSSSTIGHDSIFRVTKPRVWPFAAAVLFCRIQLVTGGRLILCLFQHPHRARLLMEWRMCLPDIRASVRNDLPKMRTSGLAEYAHSNGGE